MRAKVTVLLIDNDNDILSLLSNTLPTSDYKMISAHSGREGLSLASSYCPDVILLSLELPDMDGFQMLRWLRSWSHAALIAISAHIRKVNKVLALDLGADDIISKPIDAAELTARIRASMRRSDTSFPDGIYRALQLELDFSKRILSLEGEIVHLTQTEYHIMALLARNAGRLTTYQYLLNQVWGPYVNGNNQILRVNMANIRRKIEPDPSQPQYVFTEAGIGYRMRENEEAKTLFPR